QGYYAIAPSLYARYGDPAPHTDMHKLLADIVSKVPDAGVMSDLDASAKFAGGEDADPARLAIIGFCWGGRIVWLYAAHNPSLKAGVAWYGRLLGDKTPLQPKFPLDVVAELKFPVLGLYGGQDKGITVAPGEQMQKGPAAAQK